MTSTKQKESLPFIVSSFLIFNNHDLQSNQNDPAYMDCSQIAIITDNLKQI